MGAGAGGLTCSRYPCASFAARLHGVCVHCGDEAKADELSGGCWSPSAGFVLTARRRGSLALAACWRKLCAGSCVSHLRRAVVYISCLLGTASGHFTDKDLGNSYGKK